ncbi:FAD/NAD(P)-binding domain-containing protein [Coniophora puteana RWD-64-598 SS2]|uniref:FAD/NAD(P)-binding domain-containing protein n=1 Tax=Coniophora puteana (strain RWD-64-598) TaxID=741705 RepID=A0A5M3M997_CONPW|nr:FAD/NAD(P)-binding domain-containing protein [Coniophora puteana RWD-64-598 SS2]EIW75657.1 FAD/NAD(P)-binding domain-containing protein [Coniophora puteana RWD-64-598 SS2]
MPGKHTPILPRRTADFLRIVVVGGSIAGLATAYALRESGHHVTVLEQRISPAAYTQSKGGVRCPPNMSRVFDQWGLGHAIEQLVIKADKFTFLEGHSGDNLGLLVLHEKVMKALAADFHYIQHGALMNFLYTLAVEAGVEFHFNSRVTHVDPHAPSVTCISHTYSPSSSPQTYIGDLIVGADGHNSVIRPVVVGPQADHGVRDKRVSVNMVVPCAEMRQHPDLVELTESPEWTLWLADNCAMHGLLVVDPETNDRSYAVVMHVPAPDPSEPSYSDPVFAPGSTDGRSTPVGGAAAWSGIPEGSGPTQRHGRNKSVAFEEGRKEWWEQESWDVRFPVDEAFLLADRFEPRAQKLIRMAEWMIPTVYDIHEPFDSWVHEAGKVVLVGEAAHPLMPNGSHNASMAIEDALTLSTLLSLPLPKSTTPLLLETYEELRSPRVATVQLSERRKRDFICIPSPSPLQQMRDVGLREAKQKALLDWDDADEEGLRATWEEYLDVFGWNCWEGVGGWWVVWGAAAAARANGADRYEEYADGNDGQGVFGLGKMEINVVSRNAIVA